VGALAKKAHLGRETLSGAGNQMAYPCFFVRGDGFEFEVKLGLK